MTEPHSESGARDFRSPEPSQGPPSQGAAAALHDDAELDRLAARSFAQQERTRAASAQEERTRAARPARRSVLPWLLTTAAVAFALGMLANPWFETNVRAQLPPAFQDAEPAALSQSLESLRARVDLLEERPVAVAAAEGPDGATSAAMAERLAGLEAERVRRDAMEAALVARLDRFADQVAGVTGVASASQGQMRDMFLVAITRRMVDAGRPLGPVERLLSAQFAERDAAATDALAAWSSAPQTKATLAGRLETMAGLSDAPAADGGSWWARMKVRLSTLVQVRDPDSLDPKQMEQAVRALASGNLEGAIAAMAAMPPSAPRNAWLADARRLQAAEAAVERLEQLALQPPPPPALVLPPAGAPPPVNAPENLIPPPQGSASF